MSDIFGAIEVCNALERISPRVNVTANGEFFLVRAEDWKQLLLAFDIWEQAKEIRGQDGKKAG